MHLPTASAALVADLARIVGSEGVSTEIGDRLAYARDAWVRDVLSTRAGRFGAVPEVVVWPQSANEVGRVLGLAARTGVPVVPYGSGSGRMGGARPSRGGIVLDTKRLCEIRRFNPQDLEMEVEAGFLAERLEAWLGHRGLTLGHGEVSRGAGTIGGWLAGRRAGDMPLTHGKAEDRVYGIELVGTDGIRRFQRGPRPALTPDWIALTLGSEGVFGVLTSATLRLRPLHTSRVAQAFRISTMEQGIEAVRRIVAAGVRPAVLQLFPTQDPLRNPKGGVMTAASGWIRQPFTASVRKHGSRLVRDTVLRAARRVPEEWTLLATFEGDASVVRAESGFVRNLAAAEGALELGPDGALRLLEERAAAPFRDARMLVAGGRFVETLDVSVTWDRIFPLDRALRRAVGRDAVWTTRLTHAYREGCAVELTLMAAAGDPLDPGDALERYDRLLAKAQVAMHESGGSVVHHHGIGEAKVPSLSRELGPGGCRLLAALSRAFDPDQVMNPGKLGAIPFSPARSKAVRPEVDLPKELAAAVGERNILARAGRRVVRPPDERALAALVRVAYARGLRLESDQSGLDTAPASAVQIDLGRLDGIPRISEHSSFVEVEAGVVVERLEVLLEAHDLTLGPLHPRSLGLSVGAALARNILVRRSTGLGELADVCFAVRGLLPTGEAVETRAVPRPSAGPDLARVLVGTRGRYGIITKAALRVTRRPGFRRTCSFQFGTFERAVAAAQQVMQAGFRPVAARAWTLGEAGALVFEFVAEQKDLLTARIDMVARICARECGTFLPESSASVARGGRFDGCIEVEAPWSLVARVARSMETVSWGEVWLDFLTAEAATVVLQARDREARIAALEAANQLGARVLAGGRSVGRTFAECAGLSLRGPGLDDLDFERLAQSLATFLDPSQVLSNYARNAGQDGPID